MKGFSEFATDLLGTIVEEDELKNRQQAFDKAAEGINVLLDSLLCSPVDKDEATSLDKRRYALLEAIFQVINANSEKAKHCLRESDFRPKIAVIGKLIRERNWPEGSDDVQNWVFGLNKGVHNAFSPESVLYSHAIRRLV